MKGMQRIKRGSDFAGVLQYAFHGKKGKDRGEFLGGTCSSSDARGISEEMSAAAEARPDITKPVWHQSLSASPGERLSKDQWCELAEDYMQKMGFGQHIYAVVLHDEPGKNQHIHIVASRVNHLDKSVNLGRHESMKSTRILHELEIAHGLQQTKGRERSHENPKLPRGLAKRMERTGEPEPFHLQYMRREIKDALAKSESWHQFESSLEKAGIRVQFNKSKDGTAHGIAFEFQGVRFKGSQLGRELSYGAITKHLSRHLGLSSSVASFGWNGHADSSRLNAERKVRENNRKKNFFRRQFTGSFKAPFNGSQARGYFAAAPDFFNRTQLRPQIESMKDAREAEKSRREEEKRMNELEREAVRDMERQQREKRKAHFEQASAEHEAERERKKLDADAIAQRQSDEREKSKGFDFER